METQPMKSKKIILIRSLFTVLFCLSAVMLFGQQNNTKQPRAKQTAQVGGQHTGQKIVTGVVRDDNGDPLIGVNVQAVGTQTGVITDVNGKYSIQVSAGAKLSFSYIGFQTQTLSVDTGSVLNVKMSEDAQSLEEVVVIGYGQVTKKDATGAVATLKAGNMNKGAIITPQDMLTGKVPGLLIVPGDGQPGSGTTIRIRNGSSLSASNSPLIVIDGVTTSDDAGVGMSNVLGALNPEDIESFSVLKDASATAIYGSRASNGVIIITTKKGGSKALKVEYSSTYSANVNSGKVPVLDADEFRAYIDEYYPENTLSGAAVHKAINYTYPDGTIGYYNTDWQKEIYRIVCLPTRI